jgi:hypothetical protein
MGRFKFDWLFLLAVVFLGFILFVEIMLDFGNLFWNFVLVVGVVFLVVWVVLSVIEGKK